MKQKHLKHAPEGDATGGAAPAAAPATPPSGDASAATPAPSTPSAGGAAPSSTSGAPTPQGSQAAGATPPDNAGSTAPAGSTTAPSGDQPAAGAADPAANASDAVPESYAFTAPEGVVLQAPVIAKFSELAKEAKMTQDVAQRFVSEIAPLMAAETVRVQQEAALAQVNEWSAQSKADKEFGGDRFDANLAIAKKSMLAFASPALVELLNTTGLGNHPEVIRMFYKSGLAISEDQMVPARTPVPVDNTTGLHAAASKLYPSS